MKAKSTNKVVSVVLALLMLLMVIPFSPMIAHAAEATYVLDATADLAAAGEGSFTDGQSASAGTESYFTLYYSAKTKIDGSSKKFDDGYTAEQRVNFGGKIDASAPKNAIEFTAASAATVKVWWVEGGDDSRQITVLDGTGKEIFTSSETAAKNDMCITSFDVPAAGKYFLGSTPGNNYFFKVEVTEHAAVEYVLDATADLAAAGEGSFTDGQSAAAGTESFFTLYYSAKTKIDGSSKGFADGYTAEQRVNFGGKIDVSTPKNAVKFTTGGSASVKVWWVEGGDDSRQITVLDGTGKEVFTSNETAAKNEMCISSFDLPDAGTYYLGSTPGNNYIFKVSVTVGGSSAPAARGDWSAVKAPSITSAKQTDGSIEVVVSADVSNAGGDEVKVTMLDKDGNEVASQRSIAEQTSHTLTFAPASSGKYTFNAVLSREGESDKKSADKTADYVLPLGKANISSATSKGDGKIELIWSAVSEATGYDVYCGGKKAGTADNTKYTVSGLDTGKKYSFYVVALRGSEKGEKSAEISATATKEAQSTWGFTIYGPSTSVSDGSNGYEGSVDEDGKVTVFSENGKGKIQPSGADGISFYYTPVSASTNFTLRANVHVDSWTYSNGQDGFGLLAVDSLPEYGAKTFWTNQYMALASKVEYRWDREFNEVSYDSSVGDKYSMLLGLGVNTKLGITPELLPLVEASDTATIKAVAPGTQYPLDFTAVEQELESGSYNIVGNAVNESALKECIADLTDFVLEIQKNNTGYFISYYSQDGELIGQQKFYDPDALSLLDAENVYVGFFASRNARATFSDIDFKTVDPSEDAPAEEKPAEGIYPRISVKSGTVANSENYTLSLLANVDGKADIMVNGESVLEGVWLTAQTRVDEAVKLTKSGDNKIVIMFTPDSEQEFENGSVLANADVIIKEHTVKYDTYFAKQNNLYVAPDGSPYGNGGPDYPLDIYTAVSCVQPGQTIVVTEGTYLLDTPVRIERGIDGTADKPIKMIADPEADSRPVFDFQGLSQGFKHGGDYWYFQGFDVTNSQDGQGGFYVSGDNNVLDQINAYHNGNTGIQISAFNNSADDPADWPANNLILNCTSYGNADKGYEDADGFAAKLTVGEGNVFDGCVAYNNADDGWDLYAKVATGSIGAVEIRNCVAYNNGYLEDGTAAGNGNGFKLGGDNLSGKHKLINSIAFNNKSNGITSNSCPDVTVENCTSYNNEGSNITLYTNTAGNDTDFTVTGLISFKDDAVKSGLSVGDDIKPQGAQDVEKYTGDDNYYWDGSASKNASGDEVTAEMFVSLEFNGMLRSDDGTVDLQGFLELTDEAPENAGARPDGTPSGEFTVTPDKNLSNPRTGITMPLLWTSIALAAAAAVCIYKRKRA